MNLETNVLLPLGTASLVLAVRLFYLARRLWNYPANHGPNFFLGVAVDPGFYEGPGIQWLKRYRALLLLQHLILVCAFLVPVALRRWNDLPLMAPIDVVSFFAMIGGFTVWARRKLGANPPALSSVAVPLVARRLTDYISWPREAMVAVAIAFSCFLLYARGDDQFRWQIPILYTYAVMGMLPGMIILARNSHPLPPERTEEHYRWLEANRRHSLRVMESMRWFILTILVGYAVRHGFPETHSLAWLHWAVRGLAVAVFLLMTGVLIYGSGALAKMGRELRPAGSWTGPFQPARLMQRGGLAWGILYCCGLAALLVFLNP